MAKHKTALTTSADEVPLEDFFAARTSFGVPYFQRAYKWGATEFAQLIKDIEAACDDEDAQFLGACILCPRATSGAASKLNVYDIVDGQQRLLTIYIFVCALIDTYCSISEFETAADLFSLFVFHDRVKTGTSNLRIFPCGEDRAQFNAIVTALIANKQLALELKNPKIQYLPIKGAPEGKLKTQYGRAKRWLAIQASGGGKSRIDEIATAFLSKFTVLEIDLADPTTSPKIFERLNYRGIKVSPGDLVRNEVFAKGTDLPPADVEHTYHSRWEPFYAKFMDARQFEQYFFPFGLLHNPNVKKSDLFQALRTRWQAFSSPDEIIDDLETYQAPFLDYMNGKNALGLDKDISVRVRRLRRLGAPLSVLPFVIQFVRAAASGDPELRDPGEILEILDSFLTRRAVCGIEPTGLHAVFKRLWVDARAKGSGRVSASSVEAAIRNHKTVPWPTDSEFAQAMERRAQYADKAAAIAPYVLAEYENGLSGDRPENVATIEHVCPQTLNKEWESVFTALQHDERCNTFANLIPLSGPMNSSVQGQAYAKKRVRYQKESMFKTPREFAAKYSDWNLENLEQRAAELKVWAVKRWPI